jgi:homoserine dehydrogenase
LFNNFSSEPFSEILKEAIDNGSEPDPEDLCGNDVGRKLLI